MNLPPLFSGPIHWLFLYYTREHMLFPWGSFTIAIVFAILFPLAAQYLLQRTEV
jgi:hypothetical protein